MKSIRDGHIGGPIAFFDRDYTAVVIVSPLNQYMVANTEVDSEEGLINFGLMASVKASYFKTCLKHTVIDVLFVHCLTLYGDV